jgi:hypothetical protein
LVKLTAFPKTVSARTMMAILLDLHGDNQVFRSPVLARFLRRAATKAEGKMETRAERIVTISFHRFGPLLYQYRDKAAEGTRQTPGPA